jgi:ABC-type molybdate transport system permease subunit
MILNAAVHLPLVMPPVVIGFLMLVFLAGKAFSAPFLPMP